MATNLYLTGIPENIPEPEAAMLRSRLLNSVTNILDKCKIEDITITVSTNRELKIVTDVQNKISNVHNNGQEVSKEIESSASYTAQAPLYKFHQLIIPKEVKESVISVVEAITVEAVVFDLWGLRKIQPHPRTVLNFYGPPGTGKTLAAHAIADRMGKSILLVSYADIESKFHGEGPKNLKAIFEAAEKEGALLFIDEADSLLSKRLTDVTSGSEQAINSMRSQLLICLEQFRGVVIFATNLIENYDKAFETRVRNVEFTMPGYEERAQIWSIHLPDELPKDLDDFSSLARIDGVCGRDIREAVVDAANRAALRAKNKGQEPSKGIVTTEDLVQAIQRKKSERIQEKTDHSDIKRKIEQQIRLTHQS